MVIIVVGVGATRGWRSTIVGSVAGFAVLAVLVVGLGAALVAIPIGILRLVIGTLLLVFGIQWYRKGVMRVAARGFAGIAGIPLTEEAEWTGPGMDWTAFALAFKGVLLEGLGMNWPAGDGAIPGLLVWYLGTALLYIALERRRLLGFQARA